MLLLSNIDWKMNKYLKYTKINKLKKTENIKIFLLLIKVKKKILEEMQNKNRKKYLGSFTR